MKALASRDGSVGRSYFSSVPTPLFSAVSADRDDEGGDGDNGGDGDTGGDRRLVELEASLGQFGFLKSAFPYGLTAIPISREIGAPGARRSH